MEEKKLWCVLCGSLGVRHKKGCVMLAKPTEKVDEPTPGSEAKAQAMVETPEEEVKDCDYRVYNPNGGALIRSYSTKKFGKEARKLAYQFAEKNNYKVI